MLISFDACTINARYITAVRLLQSQDNQYSVRIRTLDGREYAERYETRREAEQSKNRVINALYDTGQAHE